MFELRDLRIHQGAFQLGPLSMTVPVGCYTLLVGPTGSGKTTLLEAIAGLRKPQSGAIRSFGIDITGFPPGDRGIGYAPQDAVVFPTMTVRQNLAFGLAIRKTAIKIQTERITELAEQLRLTPILDRLATGLSGGEAQRVALGRALAFRPKLLLLDEPMSALDDVTKESVIRLLESEELSVLHVTHDRAEVERLADTIFRLEPSTSSPMNIVRVI